MAMHMLEESHPTSQANGKKRKLPIEDESTAKEKAELASQLAAKRSKNDTDESIRQMSPQLLADHIAKKVKRSFRNLSSIELEERYPSQAIFSDTTGANFSRGLNNLPSFLEHFAAKREDLYVADETKGSPHTLVIAASGLRAADIWRSLRMYQSKNAAVAKLFAKHIKLADALEYLQRTRVGIGIGTPQRLLDLLSKDALKVTHLKRIVIDASYLDQKQRSIFDMKELLDPLLKLLSHHAISDRIVTEVAGIKVLAF